MIIISNRDINLTALRLLLLYVIRPSIEYGGEIWEGNKCQVAGIESIILGRAKRILGCSSKSCNEAVRGDTGLESLRGRRDIGKLKWWYKVVSMPEDRYPKNGKLSLVEVDKGKHKVEWLMNSLCP